MLRFLKKLRQGFLSEGNFSKYLAYALGEIILVVLGILIALQINNWNERRKTDEERKTLLSALLSDADTTQKRLDGALKMTETINNDLLYFLGLVQKSEGTVPIDTLKSYSSSVFQVANFKPATSTYDTAISTGDIGLLKNPDLLDTYIQFKDNYDWFVLHQRISGDMVYLGNVWQFRKKLGSTRLFMKDMGPLPKEFDLADKDFYNLITEKEVFATFESMQWLIRNQYDALHRARTANQQIIALLQKTLDSQ
nr:DUF6090 family protein [uncultured Allomuricauda sp.]